MHYPADHPRKQASFCFDGHAAGDNLSQWQPNLPSVFLAPAKWRPPWPKALFAPAWFHQVRLSPPTRATVLVRLSIRPTAQIRPSRTVKLQNLLRCSCLLLSRTRSTPFWPKFVSTSLPTTSCCPLRRVCL